MNIKQLERAKMLAYQDLYQVENKIGDYKTKRINDFREQLKQEVDDKFGVELNRVTAAHKCALEAHKTEADRLAKSGKGAKLPLGARYVQWDRQWNHHPWRKTGKIAIAELITAESEHPSNKSRKADIGDTVLRFLKKDGSKGSQYETITQCNSNNGSAPWGWYPEGDTPKS